MFKECGQLEIQLQKLNIYTTDIDSQLKSTLRQNEILAATITELEKENLKTPVGNKSCDIWPSNLGSE